MEDKERTEAQSSKKKLHPRENANIFSIIFFCWALPFFVKGFKKDITEDDLYQPLKAHNAKILGVKLEKVWDEEVKNGRRKPSLLRALVKIFGKEVLFLGVVVLFQELIVKMAQPYLLGKFLRFYVPHQTNVSIKEAYIYAFLIVFTTFIDVLIFNANVLNLMHVGMKIRVACSSLIYRKALRLSRSALAETTVGQMVNLISNDVSRLEAVSLHIHHIWIGPIAAIAVIYFLYTTVHPAALAGVTVYLLFIPLQIFLVKQLSTYRRQIAVKTDYRIKLMNEIVNGIQVIKMYTWEKPFAKLIEIARKLELDQIRGASYIRAVTLSFVIYLSRIALYFCILTYVLLGNHLQAQYVFVTISYYNMLRQLLIVWLPRGVSALAEAYVSVGRIEEFLKYGELETKSADSLEKHNEVKNGSLLRVGRQSSQINFGINIQGVSAKWPSSLDYTLTNINLHAAQNELIAIVGPVGGGKSTLFHIILKELLVTDGSLDIGGTISYASQEPWLFSGSIRQNILFGEKMNEKKYREVIRVCALERDFSLFPFGDRSLIGERGIMLSGGQKARINLARAIYKNADIYLLDDPLSAVDTHVGKHLFDECISDYLNNKCVVLITHQLQYLRTVDKIYLLENGSITTSGNYLELQNNQEKFVRLLQSQPSMTEEENIDSAEVNNVLKSSKLPTDIKEERSTGKVARRVYKDYVAAGGQFCVFIFVVTLFIITQLLGTGTDYFLTFWVNMEQSRLEIAFKNESLNETINSLAPYLETFLHFENCIIIYSVILLLLIILSLCQAFSIFNFSLKASKNLHSTMFEKLVYTPMRFFHTNPSGRILNRFSRDLEIIDETLPTSISDTIHVGLTVLSIIIIVATVNPWILLPSMFIFGLFYVYRIIYLAASRDLKRVESTARSPIYSHLTASVQGLTTIRAFNSEEILRSEFHNHQNLHSSAQFMYMGCSRTFSFYLDFTCILYTAFVIFSFLLIGKETLGGNVGLAITQSVSLTRMLQWGMRQWSDLENQMTSVERIVEYTNMTPEIDNGVEKPLTYWPNSGSIEFRNVSLRYSLDGAQVLSNVSFKIKSKEKIGIVGRTGAGKSSLISALFRLTKIEGIIIIEGVDIKEISLMELRSKLSIIPQDPVLFSGTLRKNLDPFEQYEDRVLWNALEEVELKNLISEIPSELQCNVSEGGTNFSVGQRQLLCLARAIVRNNKILILDEATANVDPQTDELIQATIRKKFIDCTVLTIAHRLHTVMDCDKILVMDAGYVAEFNHPHTLLQNNDGIFYGLVKQTGREMSENLRKIAKGNYLRHGNQDLR